MAVQVLRRHPLATTLIAVVLAGAAAWGLAAAYGLRHVTRPLGHADLAWLALVATAELVSIPAYLLAYRAVAALDGGPKLPLPLAGRVVLSGFAPFSAGGGFSLDKRALHGLTRDRRAAEERVLGLGSLEWALLAPAAWVSAVVLLANGSHLDQSLLWPWAVAVPLGFLVGFWLATPARVERLSGSRRRARKAFGLLLSGIETLKRLLRDRQVTCEAVVGMALYWTLDMAAFYGALRVVGMNPGAGETILAYATGYVFSRRSMPLGGAGLVEVTMTLSLHWVGFPLARSLAGVIVYRAFNFLLPVVPALAVRRGITPLLEAGDRAERKARAAST